MFNPHFPGVLHDIAYDGTEFCVCYLIFPSYFVLLFTLAFSILIQEEVKLGTL